MIVKPFRTLLLSVVSITLQTERRIFTSALVSNYPTRTLSSGLLSFAITSKSFGSAVPIMSVSKESDSITLKSDIMKWDIDKVTFINSSVAKSIDDDLMFNNGSKS